MQCSLPVVGPSVFIPGVPRSAVVIIVLLREKCGIHNDNGTFKSVQVYNIYIICSHKLQFTVSVKNDECHALAYDGYSK